ncbi:MAG: 30S ribosomal protein S8 [Alphaproteobacteria bacterium]|uniref:Small ribosomal subunit protein uS8 n=1 Tax=Candidatus Bodocaedibacter vickermanii TaxID=2741701 RepID=A0A7L9RRV7_9PROT|nr:30S ribosomal protein S8 [Alphaproteobacteria bacterium]QOL19340.1 30S ribosomal protein S8 [Candidatus Paracaedibacteraceae bacterium 'Lake Konstanz']
MSMSDPIADMLTRIRNAQQARKAVLTCPHSRMKCSVLEVMKNQGFIKGYEEVEVRQGIKDIRIELKYYSNEPVIKKIRRMSTPGRRMYVQSAKIPTYYNGLGIAILSTPKGVMSDDQARQNNVGGEILCTMF